MELEDVQSDLYALRKLYGLLQSCGRTIELQTAHSENLDERARLLLKGLLDGAMERVFGTHSKIIAAGRLSEFNAPPCSCSSSTLEQQSKANPTLECCSVTPDISSVAASPSVIGRKSGNKNKDSEDSNWHYLISSRITGGASAVKPITTAAAYQELVSCSSFSNRKKRCLRGVCKHNHSVMQTNNIAAAADEKANNIPSKDERVINGRHAQQNSDFDKEVANAIKRIESRISSLQLLEPLPVSSAMAANSVVETTTDDGVLRRQSRKPKLLFVGNDSAGQILTQREQLLQPRLLRSSANDMVSQIMSQAGGKSKVSTSTQWVDSPSHRTTRNQKKNVNKAIEGKIELLSRIVSQKKGWMAGETTEYVHGLRVPRSQEIRDNSVKNPTARNDLPRQSVGSTDFIGPSHKLRSRNQTREKGLPRQMITRPTLLDHEAHRQYHPGPRNKVFPRHQESYETSSSISTSPSSWTTQQTATSASETEGYSLPARTGPHHAGPTSRGLGHLARDSCSDESSSSSYASTRSHHNWDVDLTSKTHKSGHRMNHDKPIGRLRRFNDKLRLIFHHHHHHHHHYHEDDHHMETGHTKSKWKQLHKIFHHTKKHDVNGQQAVDKTRKSAVTNVPSKHQHGHFNALVEGLLRHVRHPKKSKPSKGRITRLENGRRGHNKKVMKRLPWWQMFRRHGGVKLPNRGRVKIGFNKSKKPRLKVA